MRFPRSSAAASKRNFDNQARPGVVETAVTEKKPHVPRIATDVKTDFGRDCLRNVRLAGTAFFSDFSADSEAPYLTTFPSSSRTTTAAKSLTGLEAFAPAASVMHFAAHGRAHQRSWSRQKVRT